MSSKTCVKLAHLVAFLILASHLKPLAARQLEVGKAVSLLSDGLTEVIQLPTAEEKKVGGICGEGKQIWPELLGVDEETAKKTIEKENPNVKAVIIPFGFPVPLDFRCDRVRVFVAFNRVVTVPVIG